MFSARALPPTAESWPADCFSAAALVVYLGLLGLTYLGFKRVPTGFIPPQDKGYVAMIAQLPDGASLERTGEVIDRISKIARETPGVKATIDLAGCP